jgi:hypothetical protein
MKYKVHAIQFESNKKTKSSPAAVGLPAVQHNKQKEQEKHREGKKERNPLNYQPSTAPPHLEG